MTTMDLFEFYADCEVDSAIDRHWLRCLGEPSPRSKWTHDYKAPLRSPGQRLRKVGVLRLCLCRRSHGEIALVEEQEEEMALGDFGKMSEEDYDKWAKAAAKLPPNTSRLIAYVKSNFEEMNWIDMVFWKHERILNYVKEFSESRYRKMMREWREKGVDMNDPTPLS